MGFVPGPMWDRHPGDAENSDVRAAMAKYDEQLRKERAGWRIGATTLEGNLTGTEYQYWIGSPFTLAKMATCRWCGFHAFSKEERQKHGDDTSALRENDLNKSCAKMLQESFKIITTMTKHCIFCGKRAYKTRWGVWLCSKECEDGWKFNQSRKYPFGRRNPDILVL